MLDLFIRLIWYLFIRFIYYLLLQRYLIYWFAVLPPPFYLFAVIWMLAAVLDCICWYNCDIANWADKICYRMRAQPNVSDPTTGPDALQTVTGPSVYPAYPRTVRVWTASILMCAICNLAIAAVAILLFDSICIKFIYLIELKLLIYLLPILAML